MTARDDDDSVPVYDSTNVSPTGRGTRSPDEQGGESMPKAFSDSLHGLTPAQQALQRTLHLEVESERRQHQDLLQKHGIVHAPGSTRVLKYAASEFGLTHNHMQLHVQMTMSRQTGDFSADEGKQLLVRKISVSGSGFT